MSGPDQQDATSSLRRALALLDAFSADHPEMSIRELSARSGVSRSTAHRLSVELVEWGALERSPRGLRLGTKLFELGTLAPTHATLRDVSGPYLHTLHEVTQLTANLAVRDGDEIVYLEKINTRGLTVPHTRLGGRGTLHATALGKAILAFAGTGDDDVDALEPTMRALTSKTLTDVESLRRELRQARGEKVAYDVEESQLGLFCVAAPVLDRQGRAIAAVSVTGATALSQAQRFAPTVIATAFAISRQLNAPRTRAR
ncbi:IclR family transcriptional regulator [Microbacterium thalassium]|uniref:DNA-binding IclR family transcriptional regulator n=1 Tax=Microbacterium thalassium TaxID=362649 RepID=A0A7X0FNB1_9MICO|nr:IclR family transcriptional regulator [Microbacterium thalassium]MBB6390653.1 DNA-binding IclR family transcriptional regulator [Microbacterium thalassium]GLK25762.1 IclR family transcriptional regulator [Microbacterium thalassium]